MNHIDIPAEWDDNYLLMFKEFCDLIGVPQETMHEWRRRGVGPRWTRFQGVGRLYVTVEEARRFLRVVAPAATRGGSGV